MVNAPRTIGARGVAGEGACRQAEGARIPGRGSVDGDVDRRATLGSDGVCVCVCVVARRDE